MYRYLISLTMLFLPGCASILGGTTQTIRVNTNPSGASCQILQGTRSVGTIDTTPGDFLTPKTRHNLGINCRKDGYEDSSRILSSGLEPWMLANLISAGWIGFGVDWGTGAWNRYDEAVNVPLIKASEAPPVEPAPPNLQPKGIGSGWFTENGDIITNYHVIEGAASLAVRPKDGSFYSAVIKKIDPANDLAVLRADNIPNIPPGLPISRRAPHMGESVFTIGYPLVGTLDSSPKFTEGSVSGFNSGQVQISAPINSGNSGGPLVSRDSGEVVGVIVSRLNKLHTIKESGTIPENINFAVNAIHVQKIIGLEQNHSIKASHKDKTALVERTVESSVLIVKY